MLGSRGMGGPIRGLVSGGRGIAGGLCMISTMTCKLFFSFSECELVKGETDSWGPRGQIPALPCVRSS